MKIIKNKHIPLEGFSCLNLFGFVFTQKDISELSSVTINHEGIHTRQIAEVTNFSLFLILVGIIFGLSPWFLFVFPFIYYLWYFYEYFFRLVYALFTIHKIEKGKRWESIKRVYRKILFEQEAYSNQNNLDYLHSRKPFNWLFKK